MRIFELLTKKGKKIPAFAKVNYSKLVKERQKNYEFGERSILSAYDYTDKIKKIRLVYIALEKFNRGDEVRIGETVIQSSVFELPRSMSYEEANKVVSYLSEKLEKEKKLEPACMKSVGAVASILEDYGFKKVSNNASYTHKTLSRFPSKDNLSINEIYGVKYLWTVGGDFRLFKRTDYMDRYYEWFREGISQDEIIEIYENCRLTFPESKSSTDELNVK